MPHQQIIIATPDGACPTHVLTPAGTGPWPAVIMYMDAGGIRPAALAMARRLADAGHVALLPDPFYRYGPYGPLVPAEVFAGDVAAILGPLMATTGPDKAAEDAASLLGYLDSLDDVAGARVGAVGFCMGGGMALAAAGAHPDRFAAVASFHGGNLVTDTPASPHLFAPKIGGEVYIAAATSDDSYPAEMAARLEHALDKAGVRYRTETYPAAHGWMVPDFPSFDAASAERGWAALAALYARTLPGAH